MRKIRNYDWYATTANSVTIKYFYKRENNTRCGNPTYRVFIFDDYGIVHEVIFHCYESFIESHVISFIESERN